MSYWRYYLKVDVPEYGVKAGDEVKWVGTDKKFVHKSTPTGELAFYEETARPTNTIILFQNGTELCVNDKHWTEYIIAKEHHDEREPDEWEEPDPEHEHYMEHHDDNDWDGLLTPNHPEDENER